LIPIRDTIPSKNVPVINNTLIAINIVIFGVQLLQGPGLDRFIFIYGLVPARYTIEELARQFTFGQQLFAWISFMFLHGGFLHLLGNMWTLYIFGDNVEDRLGPMRYLAFYVACGIASGITHLVVNAHSTMPTIGASGAIAGVMGAYFLLHPTSRILTLIPIFFIPWFVEIPAFVFLGIWFMMQFFSAALAGGTAGGIAWWAHIGGFVFGIIFLKLFARLPVAGITGQIRRMTAKKHSNRLQVTRPEGVQESDIRATIVISPYEALVGAHKLVGIREGLQQRIFRVNVPPGISADQFLRLRGQGRPRPDGSRGDLLLRVTIR
jgi:membrane associated rhomboid family serine protease